LCRRRVRALGRARAAHGASTGRFAP
jgi:hypothetical protein